MKKLTCFLAGVALALTAPAFSAVAVKCEPVELAPVEPCGSALGMYLKQGVVPYRCIVS